MSTPTSDRIVLRLRAGKHRVLSGHPWVFSNQLVEVPSELTPGAAVRIEDHAGRFVGWGAGHPGTLIAARVFGRTDDVVLNEDWLKDKLVSAAALREPMAQSCHRWVHAEADGLPGLIVDRYGDRVVLCANTAGMDRLRPLIEQTFRDRLGVAAGLWKNTGRGRSLEGLPEQVEAGWGPVEGDWTVTLGGDRVSFDPWKGQKTGLFLDMEGNRQRMAPWLGRGRLLDLFSYVGQWGLCGAAAGASEVVAVDSSAPALARAEANAAAAGYGLRTECSDVLEFITRQPSKSWDAVVCDPPSFIRSRKHVASGVRAYGRLFERAIGLVRPGGVAVLASCSHHLWADRFAQVVEQAAHRSGRSVRLLIKGGQAACHPRPMHFPEAAYLKCWLVEVT